MRIITFRTLSTLFILLAYGIPAGVADNPVEVHVLYEVPRPKSTRAYGVRKAQAIDLFKSMILGITMEDLKKRNSTETREESPGLPYTVFIHNLKTGKFDPFIRLEEPYKSARVLGGAVAENGKRVLAVKVDKRAYIVIGNKQGGVERSFELNIQFIHIFDLAMDKEGGIYILGLPKQSPQAENKTVPFLFHHWNKEGEYQWSRLPDTEEETISQICLPPVSCALQIMDDLIYVWISPRVYVYDASGEKKNTITLKHPDVSPPHVIFFKMLTPNYFLVQWVLGEHNPFFDLTLYDASGNVIQSDLLYSLRKEWELSQAWILNYWNGHLFLCGASLSGNEKHCFVASLEGIPE